MENLNIFNVRAPVKETWLIGHVRGDKQDVLWEIVIAGEEIAQPICSMDPAFGITQFRAALDPFATDFSYTVPLSDACYVSFYGDCICAHSLECTLLRRAGKPKMPGFLLNANGSAQDDSTDTIGAFSISANVEFRGIWIHDESVEQDGSMLSKYFPQGSFNLSITRKDRRFYNLSGATQHFKPD